MKKSNGMHFPEEVLILSVLFSLLFSSSFFFPFDFLII